MIASLGGIVDVISKVGDHLRSRRSDDFDLTGRRYVEDLIFRTLERVQVVFEHVTRGEFFLEARINLGSGLNAKLIVNVGDFETIENQIAIEHERKVKRVR